MTTRTNKRPAQAMGKRIAEHVMMHASETTKHTTQHRISREATAREDGYQSMERYLRAQMAGDAANEGRSVVGWEPVRYAVSEPLSANGHSGWTTERPGLRDIPLNHVVVIRLVGYGVPTLEVP